MKKYRVHYQEDTKYYKYFYAKSKKDAFKKAHTNLENGMWDANTTKGWETANGGGGDFYNCERMK